MPLQPMYSFCLWFLLCCHRPIRQQVNAIQVSTRDWKYEIEHACYTATAGQKCLSIQAVMRGVVQCGTCNEHSMCAVASYCHQHTSSQISAVLASCPDITCSASTLCNDMLPYVTEITPQQPGVVAQCRFGKVVHLDGCAFTFPHK